jgi:arylsulfatase A-like enzyme
LLADASNDSYRSLRFSNRRADAGSGCLAERRDSAPAKGRRCTEGSLFHACRPGGLRTRPYEFPISFGFLFPGGPAARPESFFAWRNIENGQITAESGYVDSRTVAEAIDSINGNDEDPWFVWFSFINPHVPAHLPPTELLHSDLADLDPDGVTNDHTFPYFLAQIEAMDTLIGRLLDGIPEDELDETYVLFLGDNGTVEWVFPKAPVDIDRAKATLFNGGVHVPFVVAGPGVSSGRTETSLTNTTDIYATIIELAGGNVAQAVPADVVLDSVSFAPLLTDAMAPDHRSWIFADMIFRGASQQTIRNNSYKLIRTLGDGAEWFYHLTRDPWEHENLIDRLEGTSRRNYDALKRQLDRLTQGNSAD